MSEHTAKEQPTIGKGSEPHSRPARALMFLTAMAVVPFVLGAIALGVQSAMLPPLAGQLAKARLLGAAVFAFGLALGAICSVYALLARSAERRIIGSAGVLLGCSQIALGIVLRKTIEHEATATGWSLVFVVLPVALWVLSAWLAFGRARRASEKPTAPTESTKEEQPRLLSPP